MLVSSPLAILFIILILTYIAFITRLSSCFQPTKKPRAPRRPGTPTRLLVILGSGGHTAEMLSLLRDLDCRKYTHRSYVVSSGDAFSIGKAQEFEEGLRRQAVQRVLNGGGKTKVAKLGDAGFYGSYDVSVVPRARRIHQSLLTTPLTALNCLWACVGVLRRPISTVPARANSGTLRQSYIATRECCNYPDLILANGPATSVMVILAALILRFLAFPGTKNKMRTIYVESWARVRRLSLSGKILLRVVDRFIVQWEGLVQATGGKAQYLGVLVS